MKCQRNRKKTETMFNRLDNFAERARKAAARLPAGKDRNDLLRKAEMAEEAKASEWLASFQDLISKQNNEDAQ